MPTGTITGTLEFFGGGPQPRSFSFNSDSVHTAATLTSPAQSLGAIFNNVTVQESTFTPITGCTVYLNATRVNSNVFNGAFTVVCPNGLQLFAYGNFTGGVDVNRAVYCQPLL